MSEKPLILIACFPHPVIREGDVLGCAMTMDGRALAEHLSSSEDFCRHDMGLTSDWQHDRYAEAFPDGYELVWVGQDFKTDPRWLEALAANRVRCPESQEAARRS